MTITTVTEYRPLLPIGFHQMTIEQVRELCVVAFPDSSTRLRVMDGLEHIFRVVTDAGVVSEMWINGSFLTEKNNPEDSDIVLRTPIHIYENGTDQQRQVIEWVNSNQRNNHLCDSYVFFVFPPEDERAVMNDYYHAYWIRQFGFSRGQDMKGIAVLKTETGK